jgi:sigma-B regulation protein RsbU (phosphoserine phosphatase)
MTDFDEDSFLTTRHIDIPPELNEELSVSQKTSVTPDVRRGKVIRISKAKAGTRPLGDADFQELLQSIYDAVLITDLNGQVINGNVRAVQFFLSDVEELCRKTVLDLISGADASLLATIRQTLQSDRFVLIQACCNRKDGTIFPAEISVNLLPLSGKDFLSFFIRDVTLRKEAEEKLRTGYNAIQNAGSGIAILDTDANLLYCNSAFARLWRYDHPEDLLGRSIQDFMPDTAVLDKMIHAVSSGEGWVDELAIKARDGSVVNAQVSAAPNLNADGELAGVVLSLLDISNLKTAQRQLEEYAQELQNKNMEMEDDLRMAREVQFTFLPRESPTYPPGAPPESAVLRFSHLYLPSGLVGGDFFDILTLSRHHVGILIADVVGHGMRAALVVATLHGLMDQLSRTAGDPGEFLTQLNKAYAHVFRQTSDRIFATAFYCILDIRDGSLQYGCAGHLPPYRLRRSSGVVEMIRPDKKVQGAALGLFDHSTYTSGVTRLEPNDVLLLYTDGLSETMSPANEFFETVEFAESLARHIKLEPAAVLKALADDAAYFSGRKDFEDDVCLLAVDYRGA